MPEKLGQAVLELRTDASRMLTGMASAQKAAMKFGTDLTRVGRTLSMRLTLPLVAAGGAAIKMAADFEKSMSEIVGLVGISEKQVNEWAEQIKVLGPEIGKSPKELADAMFFITSAGLRGAEALDVLTVSAKASVAGLGETKIIADAVTSAMNAYGKENLSAADATDILVATVREGKIEADSLAQSLGKVIPIASMMGVEFNEVGATLAALSRIGVEASEATTALRAIMVGMLKPTAEAEDILKKYGTSMADLRKKVDDEGLLAVLFELKDRFGENSDEVAKVFGNTRALTGVLGLIGDNADEASQIWANMRDNVGDTNLAFAAANKTLSMQLNKTLASFKVALVEIGEVLGPIVLPFLRDIAERIKELAVRFGNMSEKTQNFLLVIAGVAAAIGPALIILGLLAKSVGALMAIVSSAALPWILLGAAVAAIAILVIKNWDAIKEATIRLFNALKDIWMGINIIINANAAKIYHAVKDWLVDKFKDITAWLQVTWAKISNVYIEARNFIVGLFGGERIPPVDISALEKQLDGLDKRREEESAKTREQIEKAITFGTNLVAKGSVEIAELATEIGTGIADTFVGAWDKMSGMFAEMFGKSGEVPSGLDETGDKAEEVSKRVTASSINLINRIRETAVAAVDITEEVVENASDVIIGVQDKTMALSLEMYAQEQALLKQRKEGYAAFARGVLTNFITTFGGMIQQVIEGTATLWEAFKEAGKEAIAGVLEALGQMAIVKAALAIAEAIAAWPNFAKMAKQFAAAAKFTAGALLAYAGAGAVRALEFGGVVNEPVTGIGQLTGATYQIAEAGPEEVSPVGGRGVGEMLHIVLNLDRRPIIDTIAEANRNGLLIIDARTVR